MSLVNRLIREAKLGATVLNIKPNEVRKVAEHCRGCTTRNLEIDQIEAWIKDGQVKLLDVPLRVLGLMDRPTR